MKFKVLCVLVIAVSAAVILFMVLKDKARVPAEVAVSPAVAVVAETEGVVPAQTAPVAPKPQSPPPSPTMTSAPVPAGQMQQQQTQAGQGVISVDPVQRIQEAANVPQSFFGLSVQDQVAAISLALNMNEEQEVKLANYLEVKQNFRQNPVNQNLSSCLTMNCAAANTPSGELVFPPALDHLLELSGALSKALAEVKASKDIFINGLTKQQQQKFSALAVSKHL